MTFSLDGLQPEIYSSNQTWLDFLDSLAEVLEEHVRDPLKQMEDIRYFVETTDPFILVETIKMLGFDIPADLIKHNIEKLSRAIYMLSMFHEISGLDGFERSIEFVLGREVIVRTKYTNNYVDFYPQPQGPLLIDGGDWYQTTHVSLGMELVPGDRNLILPINKTLQDRLLDAYFEFAPINQVVDDFFFIQKMYATIFLTGKVYVNPTRRKVFGTGVNEMRQINARGPQTVFSQKTAKFFAEIMYAATPCYDTSYVYFGQSSANSDVDIDTLTQSSNDLSEYITNNTSGYLWFVSPIELGAVTFTDENGFIGGWDGASWGTGIGETYGPVVVTRFESGISRQWYVYRTDFPALGNYTFNVSFATQRDSSCEAVSPIVVTPPGPINPPDCTTTTINLYPVYDVAPHGIVTGSGINSLQQSRTDTQNFVLNIDIQSGYGYLAYPTALGLATFTDENGFEGGWDGASWAIGSIGDGPGEHYGPITVQRDISGQLISYYIYRTDFDNIGQMQFTIAFANPGQNLSVVNSNCSSDSCVSGYPVLLEGVAEINSDSQIVASTVSTLNTTNNTQIVVDSSTYTYLCYPIEMGLATFTDENGFVGGWDGAGWLTGEIGSTTGPIVVSRTVDGITSDWYLYRTDFEGIAQTFDIVFANPGVCVSSADPVCYVSGVPRYGSGFELHTSAHLDALTPLNLTETSFNLVVNTEQYGYFASPAALGEVTFTDSLGNVGGWDGARWPHGNIGSATGPSLVWRNINGDLVPWYLYRTDFPALGALSYTVSYQNNLQLGQSAVCNINMPLASDFVTGAAPLPVNFPIFGTGPIGIDNDYELSQLTNAFTNNSNQIFNITIPANQYGYFAHPSNLGIAHFVDENGFEGGWDGASWESTIGTYNGPIAILRNIGGTVQTWYVYRTDFPGLGTKQYAVSFGNAEEDNGYRVIRIVEPVWSTDRPDLVTFDDLGVATFGKVYTDTIVHITATYNGSSDTIAVLLRPDMPDVLTMSVLGHDEVIGGQNAVYGLEGVYDDGFTRPVDGAEYFVLSPYARFVNNTLFTDNPPSDQNLFIQARYTNDDGTVVTATKQVLLKRVLTDLHVLQISITGPSTLLESTSAQYYATVLYSNGTSVIENVVWESSAAGLYIDTVGYATASSPVENFTATIKAQYQFKGIVYETTKTVTVVVENITAVSLQIVGQNTIRELSSGQFSALLTWSNGTVTLTSANWTSSAFSISSEGILSTGSVGGTTSLSLIARAEGLSATKIVTVYNTPVVLEHISIIGANTVNEGTSSTYRVLAHYSNNTDIEITTSMYVEGNPPYVTITGNVLTFSNAQDSLIELVAVYNDGVRDYFARKQVVLVNNAVTLAGLSIIGPSEVLESKRIALAAIALYSDGTQEIVEPEWSVANDDSVNEPDVHAYIVSPGVVQGRLVTEDKTVIVTARYFTQTIDYPVIVRDYTPPGPDVPVSYRIEGPDQITVNEIGSYALICQFENCPAEIMLSNDWAIDVGFDVAILDSNGFLRSMNKQPATVTVTATWEYNGHAIQATKVVQIVNAVVISTLLINGPSSMSEQSSAQFSAEYFYSNETPVAGSGHVPESNKLVWSVSGSPLATISSEGLLSVGDLDVSTPLTITATYTNGTVLTATLGVLVAGALPPVVAHNFICGSSVLEGGQLSTTVEVFRQGMPILVGTGIVVNPATLVYSATQGTVVNGVFNAPQVNSDTVVTLTISGQYEDYTFNITQQVTVLNKVPTDMTLTGPTSITAGQTGQYVAEVFFTGDTVSPGLGNTTSAVFSIQNAPAGVTISPTGLVTVANSVDGGISIIVSATAGSITRTLSVNIQGLPLFTTITDVKKMNFALRTIVSANYMLLGQPESINSEVVLVQYAGGSQSPNDINAFSVTNILNGTGNEVPTATLTLPYTSGVTPYYGNYKNEIIRNLQPVGVNSGSVPIPLTAYNKSGNTFNAADIFANVRTFITSIIPTAVPERMVGHKKMRTSSGVDLLVATVLYSTTYNNLRAYFYVLTIFKLVNGTYTKIQEFIDPAGIPGTYQYHSAETSYYGAWCLKFAVQDGGDYLIALWHSNPASFTSSRAVRVLYKFDGTQFVVKNQSAPLTSGPSDTEFFTTNGKVFGISHNIAFNNSSAMNSTLFTVHEITDNGLVSVQNLAMNRSAGYAIPPYGIAIKTSRNLFAYIDYPSSSPNGILRVCDINPTTGSLTVKLSVTAAMMGEVASAITMRDVFFLEDGKVIGILCATATASKIILVKG